MCGEIISGYFGSPTKYITVMGVQSSESLVVTVGGIYIPSYHSALVLKEICLFQIHGKVAACWTERYSDRQSGQELDVFSSQAGIHRQPMHSDFRRVHRECPAGCKTQADRSLPI